MNRINLTRAAVLLTALGCVASVRANTISGGLWHVPEAVSQNAIPANVPASAPDVSFDVNSPFNFSGTSTTVGNWLASSGAFNVAENTAGTLAGLMDPSLVQFTGFVTVTSGQTFTVTHDDGLTLIIGGTDLGFNPGPTAPTTTTATYTGPSGTFPFELVYGECCGGPAVLQLDLPLSNTRTVPENGSDFTLLSMAFTGLVVAARRLRHS
jgi:hypothetical protein